MKEESFENDFSYKNFFVPFTKLKAIHLLVILGIIVYFNILFNGFVWDDLQTLQIPAFHTFNLYVLFGPNDINLYSFYRPLTAVYFSIMYHFFNNIAFFYHLVQLFLHIAVTCLIFLFFCLFFTESLAFVLALLFLIHPINVESVAFMSQISSELYGLFGMSALLLVSRKKYFKYQSIIVFSLLLLSFLVKEAGILFLPIVLLYQLLFRKDYFKKYLIYSVPVVLIYFTIRFFVGHVYFDKHFISAISFLSFQQRLLSIPAIIYYYIKTVIYPNYLAIAQDWTITSLSFNGFFFPLIMDLALAGLLVGMGNYIYKRHHRKFSEFLFFLFWFVIGLAMYLQIFPLDFTVADRWFYFAFIGLLGIIGVIISLKQNATRKVKLIGISIAVILLIFYSTRTFVRTLDWRNNMTLYSHDIHDQNNEMLEDDLAVELENQGQYKLALTHEKKSVSILPFDVNLQDLASIYEYLGDKQNTLIYAYKASTAKHYVTTQKHWEITDVKLAREFILYGNSNYAEKFLKESLQDYPDSYTLEAELAIVQYKLGNKQLAITTAQQAYNMSPNGTTVFLYSVIKANKPVNEILKFINP